MRLSIVFALLVSSLHAAQAAGGGQPIPAPTHGGLQPPRPPVRFAAIGDYGTTNPGSFAVAARVHALAPDFVITLGDNNYPSGAAATIDENIGQHYHDYIQPYTGSYGAGAAVNRFFPALGNHDWIAAGALPYRNYFQLPYNERYYTFARGPVQFFVLDSDTHEPDGIDVNSVQARWLEGRLARSSAPFRVVYLHHAPYCSGANHGSHGLLQWPFRAWGASLVLTGHDHLYERMSVAGFPYVVNGLGGSSLYPFAEAIGGSELRFNAADGALLLSADDESLRLSMLTSDDTVVDDYVLPRGGVDPGVTELVGEGASWTYLDTGVFPGASWTDGAFDDSSWLAGNAQLGYGDGDEATTVGFGPDANDKYVSTWFRRSFNVAAPADYGKLQLRLLYDDGARVYLNGTEVVRTNLPAGTITPTTLASSSVAGDEEDTFFPFDVDAGLLLVGANTLAVELHQSAVNSSDISFALELVGLGAGTTLLPRGSDWRYLDDGVDPGAGWEASAFDDSGWAIGPAQLGFGELDEATVTSSLPTTTWLRTSFSVAQASSVNWLECRLLRDDGARVYLNGQEALRLNLPRTGVSAATLAPFDVGGIDENLFEGTSLDPRLLVDGVNTIAVELHQSSTGADDLSFDLELVAH